MLPFPYSRCAGLVIDLWFNWLSGALAVSFGFANCGNGTLVINSDLFPIFLLLIAIAVVALHFWLRHVPHDRVVAQLTSYWQAEGAASVHVKRPSLAEFVKNASFPGLLMTRYTYQQLPINKPVQLVRKIQLTDPHGNETDMLVRATFKNGELKDCVILEEYSL